MPRLSPLNRSLLTLVACGLVLGVLSGRAELFLVIVPVLVTLVGARLGLGPRDYSLTHEVSATRIFEGERVAVTVTLEARTSIPLIELHEPLSPLVRLVGGANRRVFTLRRGERTEWRYEVECVRHGRLRFGLVRARLWDRGGLHVLDEEHRDPKFVRVYPRAMPLHRLPRPLRTQTSVGNYVAPTFGEGLEPGEIRPFTAGDRVRHVNWRASLRFGSLYVTQYHQERNADVVLMLDALAHVGAARRTSLDVSVRAAASLAATYLARKDRVGLVEYGGTLRWVKPGSGLAQYERLLDALVQADVRPTYVAKDLALVPPRVLPPQALVIALSPLTDPRFETAAIDLAARGFDLVILAISPIALTREAMAPSPALDLVCRLWALERRTRLDDLRRKGLTIIEWDPTEPLELAAARVTRNRRRAVLAANNR